jgi:hypothetical protein
VIIASFLSGSRQAFIFTPLLLVAMFLLDGRLRGAVAIIVVVPAIIFGALDLGGVDPLKVLGVTQELTGEYGEEVAIAGPLRALEELPFGMGTGTNTGPARYAFPHQRLPSANLPFNIESYYTKAIVELGAPGLLVVAGLFLAVVVVGLRARAMATMPQTKAAAGAYTAFAVIMAVQSLKGWSMDVDPINTYFWIFTGILCKLPYLEETVRRPAQTAPTPPRLVRGMARPAGRPTLARRPFPGRLR